MSESWNRGCGRSWAGGFTVAVVFLQFIFGTVGEPIQGPLYDCKTVCRTSALNLCTVIYPPPNAYVCAQIKTDKKSLGNALAMIVAEYSINQRFCWWKKISLNLFCKISSWFSYYAPSSSVRVEVKYTFCDFNVIDTRDNFESFHLYSDLSSTKRVCMCTD
jgi:hypothetical protein